MTELTNAERMARQSKPDGLKMLWRDVDPDQLSQRLNLLRELLTGPVGCDAKELSKGFKHKVVRGGGERGGGLYSVQLTGKAAEVMHHLPWWMLRTATKLHFKTYADEVYSGATDGFAEAVFHSAGDLQPSFFGNQQNERSPKNSGSRGTRIGSRKSDHQAVVYRRARERTGIEARIEDKACLACVRQVEQAADDLGGAYDHQDLSQALHLKAARIGFAKMLKELRTRGINIADYFSLITPHAQGAVGEGMYDYLDLAEEDAYIVKPVN